MLFFMASERPRVDFISVRGVRVDLVPVAVIASGARLDGDFMKTDNLIGVAVPLVVIAAVGCAQKADEPMCGEPVSDDVCSVQFGVPNEMTGLDDTQCRPRCNCGGKCFEPPEYTEQDMQELLAMVLVNPPGEVTEDPYAEPDLHQPVAGQVCGLFLDDSIAGGYRLQTFDSADAAVDAGAFITHWDGCGVCSPLTNLVVYMRQPDLTDPVRQCGLDHFFDVEMDGHVQCLMDLGFDLPCAQVWYYNTKHTAAECQDLCMSAIDQPYHNADGTLNDCLLCDEEISGPVFKAVAGRNRRNTGLPSSMCRPCDEVQPVYHIYR